MDISVDISMDISMDIHIHGKPGLAGTSSNLSGVVEIDEFAVFLLPHLRKFQE